jgi:hypothetical protein
VPSAPTSTPELPLPDGLPLPIDISH